MQGNVASLMGLPMFPSGPWDGKDQRNMASLMGHGNPMGLPMFPSGPWDGKDLVNMASLMGHGTSHVPLGIIEWEGPREYG